jgi:hypothetical protein
LRVVTGVASEYGIILSLKNQNNQIVKMSSGKLPDNKEEKSKTPNVIPAKTRIMYIFVSAGILIFSTIGICFDDVALIQKYGRGVHFHGVPAWILYFSGLFAVANMISVVIDHYDKRNNERNYRVFAKVTQILGLIFLFLAIVLDNMIFHTAHH